MSNVRAVSGLSKNGQTGRFDCIATIYPYMYLHRFMFPITALPFNPISPHISYEHMERCIPIFTTWLKWVKTSLKPFG